MLSALEPQVVAPLQNCLHVLAHQGLTPYCTPLVSIGDHSILLYLLVLFPLLMDITLVNKRKVSHMGTENTMVTTELSMMDIGKMANAMVSVFQ